MERTGWKELNLHFIWHGQILLEKVEISTGFKLNLSVEFLEEK